MKYEFLYIEEKVDTALMLLLKNNVTLLKVKASERSISHKLAEYLQQLFPEWHVDCEYNRKGLNQKKLESIRECADQRKTDRVFPDIIIHRRGIQENLLVIEIKTTKNDSDENCDFRKLELFTKINDNNEYKYRYGLFIKFNVGSSCCHNLESAIASMKWYRDGAERPLEYMLHLET